MKLAHILQSLAAERDISSVTIQQHEISIRFYSRWLGHEATTIDLETELVNSWLAEFGKTRAPRTVLAKKRTITCIWNFAADRGWVAGYNPRRLRRIRVPAPELSVWSDDYVSQLLEGAKRVNGVICGEIPASHAMRALVLVAYESGLRIGDLLRLNFSSLRWETSRIHFVQHKTGGHHCSVFTGRTMDALRDIATPVRERVFPISYSSLRYWVDRLFLAAGLDRRPGEALGQLRKSHGTAAAKLYGVEAAARSLGHVSGTKVATTHYISQDVVPTGVLTPAPEQGRPNESQRS